MSFASSQKLFPGEGRKSPIPAPGRTVDAPDGIRFGFEIFHIHRADGDAAGAHGPVGERIGFVARSGSRRGDVSEQVLDFLNPARSSSPA